jgi:hypothetical protein
MRFGVEGSLVRECCISTLPRAFVAQGVPHEEDCGRDEAQVGQDVGNDHRGGRLATAPHFPYAGDGGLGSYIMNFYSRLFLFTWKPRALKFSEKMYPCGISVYLLERSI